MNEVRNSHHSARTYGKSVAVEILREMRAGARPYLPIEELTNDVANDRSLTPTQREFLDL
jgi:hypothetical protein